MLIWIGNVSSHMNEFYQQNIFGRQDIFIFACMQASAEKFLAQYTSQNMTKCQNISILARSFSGQADNFFKNPFYTINLKFYL